MNQTVVWRTDDLVLNIEDLEGIVQQLQAITLGYADAFVCLEEADEIRYYLYTT